MHELSIALEILDLASEEARRHNAKRVESVHIRLGPLSGIVKSALLSAYDLAREHSSLPDSQLIIEDVPIVIDCQNCGKHQTARSIQSLACSVCATPSNRIVSGREMEITGLEIEE